MTHIRIIWFSHKDIKHPNNGGAEKTIFEVGKRLVQQGNEMKWFSVVSDSLTSSESLSGISLIRLPSNIVAHLMVPFILAKEKYDVVVDDMGHAVPWGSENFQRARGTVFFRHLHRRSLKGQVSLPEAFLISGIEALYPLIYRSWPFVTESGSSIDDLVRLGIRKERIVKIPPGLNEENFKTYEKSVNPAIVYYGGMRDYKRPWEALYICNEIRKSFPDTHLYMVGSGSSMEKVKNLATQMNLNSYVTFTGRLNESELRKVVGQSWVNIHSSIAEGFGYSVIEASALGTPTVAYEVPGINESIYKGLNGILVADGDRNKMIEAVIRILEEGPQRWVSSSVEVAKKYSWERTADLWQKHLEDVKQYN